MCGLAQWHKLTGGGIMGCPPWGHKHVWFLISSFSPTSLHSSFSPTSLQLSTATAVLQRSRGSPATSPTSLTTHQSSLPRTIAPGGCSATRPRPTTSKLSSCWRVSTLVSQSGKAQLEPSLHACTLSSQLSFVAECICIHCFKCHF